MKKWWAKSSPDEMRKEPWLHPDAVTQLKDLLDPSFRVLEHGSGGSTVWFAGLVQSITAIETNKGWLDKVQSVLEEEGLVDRVTMILWDRGDIKVGRKKFDLLLIDGEPVSDRAAFLKAAKKLVRPGGYVVLDNANRPEYHEWRVRLRADSQWYNTVDGNEPGTHFLVTDFFKLKGEE